MAAGPAPRYAEWAGLPESKDSPADDLLCAAGGVGSLWCDVRADVDLFDQSASNGRSCAISSKHDYGVAGHPREGLRILCARAPCGGAVCDVSANTAAGNHLN